jgi:hypothetical protein
MAEHCGEPQSEKWFCAEAGQRRARVARVIRVSFTSVSKALRLVSCAVTVLPVHPGEGFMTRPLQRPVPTVRFVYQNRRCRPPRIVAAIATCHRLHPSTVPCGLVNKSGKPLHLPPFSFPRSFHLSAVNSVQDESVSRIISNMRRAD